MPYTLLICVPSILFYRHLNIVDIMLKKLESYANNLEEIVEQRTRELVEEKKKTDVLLYRMLPRFGTICLDCNITLK